MARQRSRRRDERDERQALAPLGTRAPFLQVRELIRRVHSDACIELDTNRYSVPWMLIGESVIRGDSYRLRAKRRAGLDNQASAKDEAPVD